MSKIYVLYVEGKEVLRNHDKEFIVEEQNIARSEGFKTKIVTEKVKKNGG